jgi:hypothetical protein
VLELVHGDLCGKITRPTLMGNQFFFHMVDDKSHFMSVYLLPSKDCAPESIQAFQLRAEEETRKKLRGFRTDCGGEFNSGNFMEYCLEQGVH